VIIDAAPLVALADRRDVRYPRIRQILDDESGPLVIPAPVTAEVDYLLRQRAGSNAARRFLEDIAAGMFRVEGLTQEEHIHALRVHDRYPALDLGLADLSVVVLAYRFRTRRLLTFDQRHFRAISPLQGGAFTLLPTDT
jgi:uncharacterized protein